MLFSIVVPALWDEYWTDVDADPYGDKLIHPERIKFVKWVPSNIPLPDRLHLFAGRSRSNCKLVHAAFIPMQINSIVLMSKIPFF